MKEIPQRAKETIDNYVEKRYKPGGFITAVLANDLMTACARADDKNRHFIFEIAAYVYNNVPRNLIGSYETVKEHLERVYEGNNNGNE